MIGTIKKDAKVDSTPSQVDRVMKCELLWNYKYEKFKDAVNDGLGEIKS